MADVNNILRIDASARKAGSITRQLADAVIDQLSAKGGVQITSRDVSAGVPFIDEEWVNANFTAVEARSDAQKAKLAISDKMVSELNDADTIVIGVPVYNFSVPATLKAWIDLVCRAGLTFKYTPDGPVGLLEGKRVIVVLASGGTQLDSDIDYAAPYFRHIMGFIGITDVTVFAADALGQNTDEKLDAVRSAISNL